MDNRQANATANPWALLPIGIFLLSYLAVSLIIGDFYAIPITVAFLLAAVTSILISKERSLTYRIEQFCRGMGDSNIMVMVAIFIFAGAFAHTASAMGAVDATVNLAVSALPPHLLATGIFISACFISFSVGTSVGTIVALAPVAVGIATRSDMPEAFMLGVTVSGAMFGDNLSFISDTTIVATRTQGCKMTDKFKLNILIALPAAIVAAVMFYFVGNGMSASIDHTSVEWLKIVPYIVVLVTAVSGLNVMLVLLIGILTSGTIGILTGGFDIWGWNSAMGSGIAGMSDLIIVTLLAGGVLEMIRLNGGISWIITKLTSRIKGKRGAEASIGAMTALADLCTANNTIALIITGPIAKDISSKYGIDPRRSASIIDIASCVAQAMIPYGAQLLMAAKLSTTSPISIMGYLYYPYILGIFTILAIIFRYPRFHLKAGSA